ncbi:MAG: hypothetical protein R6U99_12655 [Nioella sp.]|uniref:HU family DNA-binding protein n=1 Tax=Nioella halotolerans TaxID=2303578 RepID=UPI0011C0CA91
MASGKSVALTGEAGQPAPGQPDTQDAAEGLEVASGQGAEASTEPPIYKMQDLMQDIEDGSDLKRGELRTAAGLLCAALGTALQDGRTVSLPGLGKITPRKRTVKPQGDILTARIKLPAPVRDRGDAPDPATGGSDAEKGDEKA